MKEKWMVKNIKANFSAICEEFGVTEVISRLLVNRGVNEPDRIKRYLNPDIESMYSPELMKDLVKTCDILVQKIGDKKKIRIIGDYDVDGIISTYVLYSALKELMADVDYQIPDRIKDGYGINIDIIEKAYADGIDTIITCDNGISAAEQILHAKELGMTVLITDHHDIPSELPEADTVVNPKQDDCSYPFKGLCGAGVVYKLVSELYSRIGKYNEAEKYIQFIAIATVCDVMELTDENRILVKYGLQQLKRTDNPGLNALINVTSIDKNKLSTYHLGYIIGPCLNATGRLETADRGIELLMADSDSKASKLAGELFSLNNIRKQMTQEALEKAIEIVENSSSMNDKILVVYLPDCHESLAGIIAGRLRERYYKPAIVLTDSEECIKGSGRSIEQYHMFKGLNECGEMLIKFGGHPLAAGLSLHKDYVEMFGRELNNRCLLTDDDLLPKISIDIILALSGINESLVSELSVLEPFGKGNEKPVFADKDLMILRLNVFGKTTKVVKMVLKDRFGTCMDAVYFGDSERFINDLTGVFGEDEVRLMYQGKESKGKLSVTYYPSINEYNGMRTLQIIIQNYLPV